MRRDSESTTFVINDLSDQPRGLYLARIVEPMLHPMTPPTVTLLWVDDVIVDDDVVQMYREILNPPGSEPPSRLVRVAMFSREYRWAVISSAFVEPVTVGEFYEAERSNVRDRVKIKQSLQQVYDAAETQTETQAPPPGRIPPQAPPAAPFDPDEWLRRQMQEPKEDDEQEA